MEEQFIIQKQELEQIVVKTQQRKFDEEIQILEKKMPLKQWLQKGIVTNFQKGINPSQQNIKARRQFYDGNQKPKKELPGFCQLVWDVLKDVILRILIVAAILTIGLQVGVAKQQQRKTAWIEGFAILIAVFIVVMITAINDYQKQRQFMKLNDERQKQKIVTVVRDGLLTEIHQDYVLVGDVVNIVSGMQIPADGILIEANEITTDQSAMTGQTKSIKKNTLQQCIIKRQKLLNTQNQKNSHSIPTPILLSGTSVLTGQGKMVITVVGSSSCLGKIRNSLAIEDKQSTPLQNKLETIAQDIGKFGIVSAVVILLVLLIRFAIEKGTSQSWETQKDLIQILHYLVLALTVVVVAIPQGLPLAVTLSLAYSVKKMLDDQNLVRRLEACQTMGGANNICSDKTGTLTKNEMTLTHFWNQSLIELPFQKQEIDASLYFEDSNFIELLYASLSVNQNSQLRTETLKQKGNATQISLLKFLVKVDCDYEQIKNKHQLVSRKPFNSERKRMSTIVNFNGKKIIFLKGASEIVLEACNQYISCTNGTFKSFDGHIIQEMKENIFYMAKKSLRTLCVAYKQLGSNEDIQLCDNQDVFQFQKSGFTLLGILGIRDIPRPQVPQAISNCKRAGITVRMVTGDNLITAKAIAEQIGIIKENDNDVIVMEGKQFYEAIGKVVCQECKTQKCDCPINQAEAKRRNIQKVRVDVIGDIQNFKMIESKLLVLARSRPEDKYALVTGLKQLNNIVAVTGDGTNDAPALKKASVGFSMGISGTQVAKQASDIILLDDNFDSIVKAVLWGRNIYDSIRKFIQFQLTVNIIAVGITFLGAAFFKQQTLSPIQMLWLNLIMDTLGSLALATEPPVEKLLDRDPHKRDDYIVSPTMMKHIVLMALFQLLILGILLFLGERFIPQYPDGFDDRQNFEYNSKYSQRGTIRSGRKLTIDGKDDYQSILQETQVYSRHMTFIFNTFVMMQIFNFVNCRKIHDEKNIFEHMCNNFLFIGIVVTIFLLQIILVTFAGYGFGVYSYFGLHPLQWLISIAIASLCLPFRLILTFVPNFKCCHSSDKQTDFAHSKSKIMDLKRVDAIIDREISYARLVQ